MKRMIVACLLSLCCTTPSFAVEEGPRIEIPVKLKTADVVFNMDHLAFEGSVPTGINYMRLISATMKADGTKGQLIAIFHGDAAYMTLNDASYNANRHVTTGNPYKGMIQQLQQEGVQIEECVNSMRANHWVNEQLLPGVKVNGGAILRIVELEQQGYIQIQP
jgi:intracellular sulfur oxidation DsrE/DsrF family protein